MTIVLVGKKRREPAARIHKEEAGSGQVRTPGEGMLGRESRGEEGSEKEESHPLGEAGGCGGKRLELVGERKFGVRRRRVAIAVARDRWGREVGEEPPGCRSRTLGGGENRLAGEGMPHSLRTSSPPCVDQVAS